MSRGHGRHQRELVTLILHRRRQSMTFKDILAAVREDCGIDPNTPLRPAFMRSLRYSLQRLVRDEMLIAFGSPYRYAPHPILASMAYDLEEYRRWWAEIKRLHHAPSSDDQ
jgi:hypothetical protein